MFDKLKKRWKVNELNLLLIITTFALGGSLCGYAGRKLLALTSLDKGAVWVVLYIVLITILWPLAVLLVSIPLGQFSFFKNYINKILKRFKTPLAQHKSDEIMGIEVEKVNSGLYHQKERVEAKILLKENANDHKIINLAIFASGAGSNAEQIIKNAHFTTYNVCLIVCNKPGAGVLNIADNANIPSLLIEKERFFKGDNYLPELKQYKVDFIVLAGFLWKVPLPLILAYPKKIINIHPALLPQYGGKGMYGHYVHESVVKNKEKESGITIHYVDEIYDHGTIIFQSKCTVEELDTAQTLAKKIHTLEHEHYPKVIANLLQK